MKRLTTRGWDLTIHNFNDLKLVNTEKVTEEFRSKSFKRKKKKLLRVYLVSFDKLEIYKNWIVFPAVKN